MIRMMKKIGNGLGAVIGVLSVVLAAALVGVRLVGLRPFVVLSGSMEPTYPVGSLIYVKQVDYKTLSVGDAITFMMDENTVVTHRIIEILPDETEPDTLRFITRGDANDAPDGGAEKFIFAPGTRQSPTSLFEDFLDMMPGDERTERIEIRSARRRNGPHGRCGYLAAVSLDALGVVLARRKGNN